MDSGYDIMLAMQDAMDEKKFLLVWTLLSKCPHDNIVQSRNLKNQNLFHILSINSTNCNLQHLQRILKAFKKRGVEFISQDNFGRTALHYAAIS